MRAIVLFLLAASAQAQDVASCWVYGPRSSNNEINVYPNFSVLIFSPQNAAVIVTHSCEREYYYEPVVYAFRGEWLQQKRDSLFKLKDDARAIAKADNMAELQRISALGEPLDTSDWVGALAMHKRNALWEATGIKWFVVAKNGTRTDRPAYPFTATARSTTAATYRAKVGQLCRCHVKAFPESGGLYCEHAGYVTLCTKQ